MEPDETPLLDNAPVYDVDCDGCGKTFISVIPKDIDLDILCYECENELLTQTNTKEEDEES
tara:strand:- start:9950 stop:10132 length:183 start_codon:yes stop_codon:yes gene_type:complete